MVNLVVKNTTSWLEMGCSAWKDKAQSAGGTRTDYGSVGERLGNGRLAQFGPQDCLATIVQK